jgi:hypothetical protein
MIQARGLSRNACDRIIRRELQWSLADAWVVTCRAIGDGLNIQVSELLDDTGHVEVRSEIDASDSARAHLQVLIDLMDPE